MKRYQCPVKICSRITRAAVALYILAEILLVEDFTSGQVQRALFDILENLV